ncbi:integral membrane protein [Aspergillus terreus]|uniref:Integral membrane protein n=1 Tax=Aspergillus terreus TaxID=33178 RepID=A0A5M3YXS7_ASPTE|nr:hypothetical protein ATETN484_0005075600 [Aspergillus terreus]GFF17408.1 integral membrane protein [Aspergillus terreus]
MAFVAFYFLVFLGLTWNVFRRKRDSPVGWVPLALSIVFMFIGVTVFLVIQPVYECGAMSNMDYNSSSIAIDWLLGAASLFLVATLMVPICKIVTQGSKIVGILGGIYVTFLAVLWTASLAISTKLAVDGNSDYYYGFRSDSLRIALNGLRIALGVFMVIGVLLAGLVIIVQIIRKSHLRKGITPVLFILLIGSALAFTICDFATYLANRYSDGRTVASVLVGFFLYYLFFAVAALSATIVISSPRVSAERSFPSHIPPPATNYGPHYQFVPQNVR